jgi:hypothetical protein
MTSKTIIICAVVLLLIAGYLPFKFPVPLPIQIFVALVAIIGLILLRVLLRTERPTENAPQSSGVTANTAKSPTNLLSGLDFASQSASRASTSSPPTPNQTPRSS